jgi:hypothetical protein
MRSERRVHSDWIALPARRSSGAPEMVAKSGSPRSARMPRLRLGLVGVLGCAVLLAQGGIGVTGARSAHPGSATTAPATIAQLHYGDEHRVRAGNGVRAGNEYNSRTMRGALRALSGQRLEDAGSAATALPVSGAGGFGEPRVVGPGPVSRGGILVEPVAALDARGDAALAWSDGARVHVARRAPGGVWTARTISRPADGLPDLQLVITPAGDTIVAWTETHADRPVKGGVVVVPDGFLAAIAPAGRPFRRPQVISNGPRADSALPRLVALSDGRVVLVWRTARAPRGGELRMAFLGADHRFGRSERLGLDGVAPAVVATSDGGAVVSWVSPCRRCAHLRPGERLPRRLLAARLPAGGRRLEHPFEISPSAVAGARLAAGPAGVVMASWASRGQPAGLLAAQITPRRGPVRVLRPGAPKATAAPIAVGPDGSTLATFLAPSRLRPPGSGSPGTADEGPGQWVATGTATAGFRARVELATGSRPLVTASLTILPTGEALVAWSEQLDGKVVVARKPAGSSEFVPPETLSSDPPRPTTRKLVTLAQAAGHVLIAWPGPDPRGGMIVAERT